MAKITSSKRLNKDEFPDEYQDLIDTLSFSINPFFEQIYGAFTNGLTFKDNFYGQAVTVTTKVDAQGRPVNNQVPYTLKSRPQTIMVLNVVNNTDSSGLTSAPYVGFSLNGSTLTLNYITGLVAGKEYTLSLFILG